MATAIRNQVATRGSMLAVSTGLLFAALKLT